MKLNNRGFAISSIMYIILVLAVVLIFLTLATLSSRKLILDKLKSEVYNDIYDRPSVSYRKVLNTLKEEAISYATANLVEKESIKIENIDSSIDDEVLEKYDLSSKYLTMVNNSSTYDVYLGESKTITNEEGTINNLIDIIDYKIYGNVYQKTSVQGKNLFNISNRTLGTLSSPGDNTSVREFEFDKYYVGLTCNNYYYPTNVVSHSVSSEKITVKSQLSGYGIAFPIKVKSNTNYSLSAITEETISIGFYTSSGEYISDANTTTFTTPENCEIITVVLRPHVDIEAIYTNIQLEEGDKVTEYEEFRPNMPSLEYPSEIKNIGDKTKNLFDNTFSKYTKTVDYWVLPIELKQGVAYTIKAELVGESMTGIAVGITPTGTQYSEFIGRQICLDAQGRYSTQIFTVNSTWDSPKLIVYASSEQEFNKIFENYHIQLEESRIATEYEPFGYKIPVITRGKNLFDYETIYSDTTKFDITDGVLSGISNDINSMKFYIPQELVGKELTFSADLKRSGETNAAYLIAIIDGNKVFGNVIRNDEFGKAVVTFTPTSTENRINITYGTGGNGTIQAKNIQLELGNTATEYEPYIEPVITNIYLDQPLRKTDDVVDHIEYENQQIKTQIKELLLNDGQSWKLNTVLTGVNRFYLYLKDSNHDNSGKIKNQTKSSHFNTTTTMYIGNRDFLKNLVYVYNYNVYFYTDPAEFPDLEAWKSWIKNNNVVFHYKLKEEASLSTELPKINSSMGATQISVDTELEPSKYEFTIIEKLIKI